MTYILYNPQAGGGKHQTALEMLEKRLEGEVKPLDVTSITNYSTFLSGLEKEDTILIAGGDGTLNCFINAVSDLVIPQDILYFPAGSGNDFAHEIGLTEENAPVSIKKYVQKLPTVTVSGNTYRFLNGVGYGIDGYVCEEGDRIRKKTGKPINYTGTAVKGLLGAYKQTHATVTVDGETMEFDHVWMTPTMLGRFFGGGMMCAPGQDRLNMEGTVSLMVMRCRSKLRTLLLFPTIFKGNHVKKTKIVSVFKGHEMTVRFDRPTALQIDGEVYSGVTEYTVTTAVADRRKAAETQPEAIKV